MISQSTIEEATRLLDQLKAILEAEREANWLRGINAALGCLQESDREQGFQEAKSIYTTMATGKGAFSDYYIQHDNPGVQLEANKRLDKARNQLWQLFHEQY